MSVKQISIFVENKPGAMHEMTTVLAKNGIDMRALSLAETEGFGIVRIIVEDVLETTTVLKEAGYVNKLTPVLVVAIPDETGGLNQILSIFTENEINVEYMYAILGGAEINDAYMIFRVDDEKKAERVLRERGIRMLTQEEVASL